MKNIQVELEGRGRLILSPSQHIATGGEGSVYRVNQDTVVKVYSDISKMRSYGIEDKLRMLMGLKHPYIIAPQGLAFSGNRSPAGFYMPYVEGTPLPMVFTNAFWKKEGLTGKHASGLVEKMREAVLYGHEKGAILVDANEFNWIFLCDKNNPEPRVVDVDSWSIGKWPATVVMPSIRDYHTQGFTEESDWFSWGVVTFQIFSGIHPYKGTLKSFRKGDMEGRMKANASVFSSGIRLNQAVRDFSIIPKNLLDWYMAVFQDGDRETPPVPDMSGIKLPSRARTKYVVSGASGQGLSFEKIFERTNDPVVRIFSCGIALLDSGALIDLRTKRDIGKSTYSNAEVVKVDGGWILAELSLGALTLFYIRERDYYRQKLSFSIRARALVSVNNRLFAVGDKSLIEVRTHFFSGKVLASAGEEWSVLSNSTTWFRSLGVEDAMGAKFVVMPDEVSGMIHVRVKELDDISVVSAKAGSRFVSVVGADKAGKYFRIEIVFNRDYSHYKTIKTEVDQPELNVAILERGVVASIHSDEELEVFVPSNGATTKVSDKAISTEMLLVDFGEKVAYMHLGAVWVVSMS